MERPAALEGASSLHAVGPLTFQVGVFSEPPEKRVKQAYGSPVQLKLDQKPGEIVRSAIMAELVRTGHRILANHDAGKADVTLDGAVVDFHANMWLGIHSRIEPVVLMTLRVASGVEPQRILLSKEYQGTAEQFRCVLCPSTRGMHDIAEELLRRALRNMVRDITMDPAFLEALEKCSPATAKGS